MFLFFFYRLSWAAFSMAFFVGLGLFLSIWPWLDLAQATVHFRNEGHSCLCFHPCDWHSLILDRGGLLLACFHRTFLQLTLDTHCHFLTTCSTKIRIFYFNFSNSNTIGRRGRCTVRWCAWFVQDQGRHYGILVNELLGKVSAPNCWLLWLGRGGLIVVSKILWRTF